MIRPFVSYVTVINVEHDDAPVKRQVTTLLGGQAQIEQKQGIRAGVVQAVGDGIPDLVPGCKVYYSESYAYEIEDVQVVHAGVIIAWEEAP